MGLLPEHFSPLVDFLHRHLSVDPAEAAAVAALGALAGAEGAAAAAAGEGRGSGAEPDDSVMQFPETD
jgi:hypothetical protein